MLITKISLNWYISKSKIFFSLKDISSRVKGKSRILKLNDIGRSFFESGYFIISILNLFPKTKFQTHYEKFLYLCKKKRKINVYPSLLQTNWNDIFNFLKKQNIIKNVLDENLKNSIIMLNKKSLIIFVDNFFKACKNSTLFMKKKKTKKKDRQQIDSNLKEKITVNKIETKYESDEIEEYPIIKNKNKIENKTIDYNISNSDDNFQKVSKVRHSMKKKKKNKHRPKKIRKSKKIQEEEEEEQKSEEEEVVEKQEIIIKEDVEEEEEEEEKPKKYNFKIDLTNLNQNERKYDYSAKIIKDMQTTTSHYLFNLSKDSKTVIQFFIHSLSNAFSLTKKESKTVLLLKRNLLIDIVRFADDTSKEVNDWFRLMLNNYSLLKDLLLKLKYKNYMEFKKKCILCFEIFSIGLQSNKQAIVNSSAALFKTLQDDLFFLKPYNIFFDFRYKEEYLNYNSFKKLVYSWLISYKGGLDVILFSFERNKLKLNDKRSRDNLSNDLFIKETNAVHNLFLILINFSYFNLSGLFLEILRRFSSNFEKSDENEEDTDFLYFIEQFLEYLIKSNLYNKIIQVLDIKQSSDSGSSESKEKVDEKSTNPLEVLFTKEKDIQRVNIKSFLSLLVNYSVLQIESKNIVVSKNDITSEIFKENSFVRNIALIIKILDFYPFNVKLFHTFHLLDKLTNKLDSLILLLLNIENEDEDFFYDYENNEYDKNIELYIFEILKLFFILIEYCSSVSINKKNLESTKKIKMENESLIVLYKTVFGSSKKLEKENIFWKNKRIKDFVLKKSKMLINVLKVKDFSVDLILKKIFQTNIGEQKTYDIQDLEFLYSLSCYKYLTVEDNLIMLRNVSEICVKGKKENFQLGIKILLKLLINKKKYHHYFEKKKLQNEIDLFLKKFSSVLISIIFFKNLKKLEKRMLKKLDEFEYDEELNNFKEDYVFQTLINIIKLKDSQFNRIIQTNINTLKLNERENEFTEMIFNENKKFKEIQELLKTFHNDESQNYKGEKWMDFLTKKIKSPSKTRNSLSNFSEIIKIQKKKKPIVKSKNNKGGKILKNTRVHKRKRSFSTPNVLFPFIQREKKKKKIIVKKKQKSEICLPYIHRKKGSRGNYNKFEELKRKRNPFKKRSFETKQIKTFIKREIFNDIIMNVVNGNGKKLFKKKKRKKSSNNFYKRLEKKRELELKKKTQVEMEKKKEEKKKEERKRKRKELQKNRKKQQKREIEEYKKKKNEKLFKLKQQKQEEETKLLEKKKAEYKEFIKKNEKKKKEMLNNNKNENNNNNPKKKKKKKRNSPKNNERKKDRKKKKEKKVVEEEVEKIVVKKKKKKRTNSKKKKIDLEENFLNDLKRIEEIEKNEKQEEEEEKVIVKENNPELEFEMEFEEEKQGEVEEEEEKQEEQEKIEEEIINDQKEINKDE